MTAMILLSEFENSQIEFWLPIKGWPGYDVSSKGQIRSFKWREPIRGQGKSRGWKPVILNEPRLRKPCPDGGGYVYVSLCTNDRRRKCPKIHRLVAAAFLPNPNSLPEINHKTGVKSDNRVGNLERVTRLENARHANKNGLRILPKGENNHNAKLTESKVLEMRKRAKAGEATGSLAREFGIDWKTASTAIRGTTWKYIPLEV